MLQVELSSRELEIVHGIIAGKTSSEIAWELSLSVETVKWYRKKLLHKYEARNSAALISVLKEYGEI